MLVAWVRQLLDPALCVLDNPVIRERRVEVARAILDVLWAVMAQKDAIEDQPQLLPGPFWHHFLRSNGAKATCSGGATGQC